MLCICIRYGESFPVSEEVLDSSFSIPIGKAKVRGSFPDISSHILFVFPDISSHRRFVYFDLTVYRLKRKEKMFRL